MDRSPLIAEIATERLEAEICEYAGHIAAATARWILLVAEYDDRQAWVESGCLSAAHWLSWKCGVGMHAAREKLRVGHALAALPLIRAAFQRGELSYSQARAITRIAQPHNEAALVDIARASTANQLDRLVAATARAEKIWDSGFAAAQLAERSFSHGFNYDLAMYTAKLMLCPDDGRALKTALQLAVKQLKGERGDQGPDTTPEQLLADAVMLLVSSFLTTGRNEGTGTDDYRTVVFADGTVVDPDPASHREHCADGAGDAESDGVPRDAPRAHLEGGSMLTAETIRRIWCDPTVTRLELRDGAIVEINEPSRIISASLRRALGLRDSQCRFPGCSAQRVDAHHIRYRSRKGPTTLTNLLSLCRFHHKLVHEGGFTVGRGTDGEVRFYDPRGRQLHNRSELVANDGAEALRQQHRDLGIDINPDTIVGNYCGDKLDMHYAVSVLTRQNVPAGTRGAGHAPTSPQGPALN
jgi:hypothetical protein